MLFSCSSEQVWFESHSEYSEVAKQCGVGNLAKRINVILGEECVGNMLCNKCCSSQHACSSASAGLSVPTILNIAVDR
jgi:hypothetical protein